MRCAVLLVALFGIVTLSAAAYQTANGQFYGRSFSASSCDPSTGVTNGGWSNLPANGYCGKFSDATFGTYYFFSPDSQTSATLKINCNIDCSTCDPATLTLTNGGCFDGEAILPGSGKFTLYAWGSTPSCAFKSPLTGPSPSQSHSNLLFRTTAASWEAQVFSDNTCSSDKAISVVSTGTSGQCLYSDLLRSFYSVRPPPPPPPPLSLIFQTQGTTVRPNHSCQISPATSTRIA